MDKQQYFQQEYHIVEKGIVPSISCYARQQLNGVLYFWLYGVHTKYSIDGNCFFSFSLFSHPPSPFFLLFQYSFLFFSQGD